MDLTMLGDGVEADLAQEGFLNTAHFGVIEDLWILQEDLSSDLQLLDRSSGGVHNIHHLLESLLQLLMIPHHDS